MTVLAAAGLVAWLAWSGRLHPPGARPAPARWPVVVATVAGSGAPGVADGVVSEASFGEPFGVAVDDSGNTYVADAGDSNRIRRIDGDGRVTTLAGGTEGFQNGGGGEARFDSPSGLALAADGALIVADTGNHAIRRLGPDGHVTTVAGGTGRGRQDGPAATATFDSPIGVAVGPDGVIYVADSYNDCIRAIALDGAVTTVAGGGLPGYRDGRGLEARFDTPAGIAVDARGVILVADTGNNLLRRIDRRQEVTTLAAGDAAAALWRPVGVTVSRAGDVYVTDGGGRVSLFEPDGRFRVLAGGLPGFADGRGATARFNNPTGVAVDSAGIARVADSDNYLVRALTPPGAQAPARDVFLSALPRLSPAALGFEHVPWPVDPQEAWHEVTATLGEARGSVGGDGRERLHAGIDVHAEEGTLARAVHDEKVGRPIAATGFGELNESIRVGLVSYVHVKVGRDRRDASLDPSQFELLYDDNGVATRIRVRRGTRFRLGDAVGTVNRFTHVHLGLGPRGAEVNLLGFSLAEFGDHVTPTIPPGGVWLVDEAGVRLKPLRGRVEVDGRVAIVAEAWDQVDRNERRRRLGVYALGYQVLRRDGTPLEGFEEPRMTIRFDRLPQTAAAGEMAYAQGSGITVYGNRATRFRYQVTNEVRDGEAVQGWWDAGALAPGDYRVRVFARDAAGNSTSRELPVRVVRR
jgi:sugar lactone lactonase YvrE